MINSLNPSKYAQEFLSCARQNVLSPLLSLTCGAAEDEIFLAQQGLSVVALDNEEGKIAEARNNIPANIGLDLKILKTDILKPLPFAALTFNSLYWKFGLHYFSGDQIKLVIIPEVLRALNPDSLVSIIFRYIDITNVDIDRYEIMEYTGNEVQFLEKGTGKVLTRYIWDEESAQGLFAGRFDIIKSETRRENLFERFSNSNNTTVISMLLMVI